MGGIQAADKANDSPATHYLDAFGGGHYKNIPELLEELVTKGPLAIDWLSKLGVMFDKEADGTMVTTHGGGTSRKRMHACADYTGAEIMRVLRDEVVNRGIPVLEFAPAIELLLDEEGKCAGAVLLDYDSNEYKVVRAKTVNGTQFSRFRFWFSNMHIVPSPNGFQQGLVVPLLLHN